ncbi:MULTISPECIES: TonB-dependent copper receptor [Idiomarina]|uniref:TonB-dependent copper receptor n=1 Tax=Idiomarina TaxID=135575 RepID=UPI00129C992B|nr:MULTISPECIES: TonB-dependent copper receptor [Idiomarina]MRJ42184.1 TonB-dependent copper receptor [Idiomarina sp. FeN1]NCU57110.1 TonB-dependent copper receptor [Idiomarina sp. FenA--70]NCU59819.1 TonB-dependent copper receptor [Idiomarina sp. FenBw--71]UUN13191.1 TonB-dependent copper receptor [Idiomarina loihiensis]
MFAKSALALFMATLATAAIANEPTQDETDKDLERIIITGVKPLNSIELAKDTKAPQQPIPAHDGADYLKSIPGFSIIRKGGTSGDPVFRGAAGSRLTIAGDDQMILGGCSGRMDPPTAYINPQNFDRIRIIKGPQSLLYGPASATVLFERENYQFDATQSPGQVSLIGAAYGRREFNADYGIGNELGFMRLSATHSEADAYEDGNGVAVNSAYERWGTDLQLGWTPSADTLLMVTLGNSGAEAAYADRAMDGSVFDRDSASLRWRQAYLTDWLAEFDAQVYYGYVDHVMDNYSLRDFRPTAMMPNPAARNPDRYTRGGRLVATIDSEFWSALKVGLDHQYHEHRERVSMNQPLMPYEEKPRIADAIFEQTGFFAEASYALTDRTLLLSGVRFDQWQALDQRQQLGTMMSPVVNPTANAERDADLVSAFMRAETKVGDHQWFVGVGRAERFPDFWEIIGNKTRSEASLSSFFLDTEVNHQLDVGYHLRQHNLEFMASLFYSRVDNYILIENGQHMAADLARSIKAESFGGELLANYRWSDNLLLDASVAYTHGSNLTDHLALAQQPPLELKFGAEYQLQDWTFAGLWRVVDNQHRVAIGQGNIVGNDFKATAGFGTLAINAHWSVNKQLKLSFGIDNLLDKAYAEHLSSAGAMVAGFEQITQVNEPGRIWWFKLDYHL